MTDEEFIQALESCKLPESDFGHAAHVRAGYLYLGQTDFVHHGVGSETWSTDGFTRLA